MLAKSKHAAPGGHLTGGVKFWDGRFDDARRALALALALALARTAAARGALLVTVNYCAATGLIHAGGKVLELQVKDVETGSSYDIKAKADINAFGVWVNQFRTIDSQATGRTVKAMVASSQGVNVVVYCSFYPEITPC